MPRELPKLPQTVNSEFQWIQALQKALKDPHATWASQEQKDAVQAVMERRTDVIAMLKTGGGKSMLAIIPAIVSPNIGIVVVLPLKSLMTDWQRKLDAMEIPYQTFDPSIDQGRLHPSINLILVSADRATFSTWRTMIAELHESLPITRMVFDEAHLPLLSDDFRNSLGRVNELRQHGMQMILLSATVPPASVDTLKSSFGVLKDAIEIRQCSNRTELEYILKQPVPSGELSETLKTIISQEQEGWKSEDRGLIFVTYIADGEALANDVSICMSYGEHVY